MLRAASLGTRLLKFPITQIPEDIRRGVRNEETIELEHMAAKSQTQNEWSVEPEGNTERVESRPSGVWSQREGERETQKLWSEEPERETHETEHTG